MLGTSPHAFKVNLCKYTNETRCSIEDATLNPIKLGLRLSMVLLLVEVMNSAGMRKIYLIDDGFAAVSLQKFRCSVFYQDWWIDTSY